MFFDYEFLLTLFCTQLFKKNQSSFPDFLQIGLDHAEESLWG